LTLLGRVMIRQCPDSIVLERDDRLDAVEEIIADLARLRAHLAPLRKAHDRPLAATAG
jgi:hypothetical protein